MAIVYKKRKKPAVLAMLEILKKRAQLSAKAHKYYLNQKKGYLGECCFDALTEKIKCDCLVLNDLPFQDDGNEFQIDALIITAYTIYLYEIKNYEGEYYYKDGFFHSVSSNFKFESPIEWLNRKETYLQKILYEMGVDLPIKSFIVFVNPEFTLYDVSYSEKVLLPTSITRHFCYMDQLHGSLSQMHTETASKLCELSAQYIPRLKGVPRYEFQELEKGLICRDCESFLHEIPHKKKFAICSACNHQESASQCTVRHIEEYKTLFPDGTLTVDVVYNWCGGMVSKRSIAYTLQKHYQAHGSGRGRYYS